MKLKKSLISKKIKEGVFIGIDKVYEYHLRYNATLLRMNVEHVCR